MFVNLIIDISKFNRDLMNLFNLLLFLQIVRAKSGMHEDFIVPTLIQLAGFKTCNLDTWIFSGWTCTGPKGEKFKFIFEFSNVNFIWVQNQESQIQTQTQILPSYLKYNNWCEPHKDKWDHLSLNEVPLLRIILI